MEDFPNRTPSDDHKIARRFTNTYWFSSIVSGLAWMLTLVGAILGMIISYYFGIHRYIGAIVGAVVAHTALTLFLRRDLRLHEAKRHEEAQSIRDEREAEVQRKIAQAKADGTFDRWNKPSDT